MIKQLRKELKERVEKMIERHGPGQMPPERVCELALDLLMETAFTKEHDPNMRLGDFMTLLYGPPPTSGSFADLANDVIRMAMEGPEPACTFAASTPKGAEDAMRELKEILAKLPPFPSMEWPVLVANAPIPGDPFLRAKRAGQKLVQAVPSLKPAVDRLQEAFAEAAEEIAKKTAKLVAMSDVGVEALRKADENAMRQIRGMRQRQDQAQAERDAACRRHGDEIIAHGKTHERLIRQREQLRLREQELANANQILGAHTQHRDAIRDLCGGNANAFDTKKPPEYLEGVFAMAQEILKAMTSPPDNPLGYMTITLTGPTATETLEHNRVPPEPAAEPEYDDRMDAARMACEPHCQPLPPIEDATEERTGPAVELPTTPGYRSPECMPAESEVLLTLDEASEAIKVALRSVGFICDFVPPAALIYLRGLPR
jgi:hypothetical protein